MSKHKQNLFSKLNIFLVILLVGGLLLKFILILNILNASVSSVIFVAAVAAILIHLLLIWGVYKKITFSYILTAIFAGNSFRDFDFMSDWYYPMIDLGLDWFMLLDLVNISTIVLSVIQVYYIYKTRQNKKKQ